MWVKWINRKLVPAGLVSCIRFKNWSLRNKKCSVQTIEECDQEELKIFEAANNWKYQRADLELRFLETFEDFQIGCWTSPDTPNIDSFI